MVESAIALAYNKELDRGHHEDTSWFKYKVAKVRLN